jgi:hypothetical protein
MIPTLKAILARHEFDRERAITYCLDVADSQIERRREYTEYAEALRDRRDLQ